ncbi:hypothetical protein NOCA2250007 [metagenome]|uniref:Uncharacterized protein n=1 Tax=metagenome TaxID=256318 RepID=A0A2P2C044_9ZZZZ
MRMELILPALAHRVTVLGSTRNRAATSAGVSRVSESVDCALMNLCATLSIPTVTPRESRWDA